MMFICRLQWAGMLGVGLAVVPVQAADGCVYWGPAKYDGSSYTGRTVEFRSTLPGYITPRVWEAAADSGTKRPVEKPYKLFLSAKKSEILVGGNSADSKTQIFCALTNAQGKPVAGQTLILTSVYANGAGKPSEKPAGVLSGQENEHPDGDLHRLRVKLDDKGKAVVTLAASRVPAPVGKVLVRGNLLDQWRALDLVPAKTNFVPPQGGLSLKVWAENIEKGTFEAHGTIYLHYAGKPVTKRSLKLEITSIEDPKGKKLPGDLAYWAHFAPDTVETGADGIAKTILVWEREDLKPDDYKIEYEVLDNHTS